MAQTLNETVRDIAKGIQRAGLIEGSVMQIDTVNRVVSIAPLGSPTTIRAQVPVHIDMQALTVGAVVSCDTTGRVAIVKDVVQVRASNQTTELTSVIEGLAIRIAQLEAQVATLIRQNEGGSVQQALIDSIPRTSNRG